MLTPLAGGLQDLEITSENRPDGVRPGLPPWAANVERALGLTIRSAKQLSGGASKETWRIVTADDRLILRRATGGSIYSDALGLEDEFKMVLAAAQAGVKVPRGLAYFSDLSGRDGFVMEHVTGVTIGTRVVRKPPPNLDLELATELARIHSIDPTNVPFLVERPLVDRMHDELHLLHEPHPAIEYGLKWLREHRPAPLPGVVSHGDFRVGNVAVSKDGLQAILDWEFAKISDPREDLAWPLVRSWRFGIDSRHLGGIAELSPYLAKYCELTAQEISAQELDWWEIASNLKWALACHAQARRHLSGDERSVELALLGRKAAEVEYELLDLIERAQ